MIPDIIDFFKGLIWSEDSEQDEDSNNEPASTSNNNDLASADADNNNGNAELPDPAAQNDADNAETDPHFVQSDTEQANSLGHLDVHCDYLELHTWDKFEQYDPYAKVYLNYNVKTELTHDYLVQNPWVQDVISGGTISDDIKTIEIEYVANSDICPQYQHQKHIINTANLDFLSGFAHLVNCDGNETLAYISNTTVAGNCQNISFAISDHDQNSYHIDLHYTDNANTDQSLVQLDTDEASNSDWNLCMDIYLAINETDEIDESYENTIAYFSYATKADPKNIIKNELTYEYVAQNPWVQDAISDGPSDDIAMAEVEYGGEHEFHVDLVDRSIDIKISEDEYFDAYLDCGNVEFDGQYPAIELYGTHYPDYDCELVLDYFPK